MMLNRGIRSPLFDSQHHTGNTNHYNLKCLFNSLFKLKFKTSYHRSFAYHRWLTGGCSSQRASNEESVFMPWRHYKGRCSWSRKFNLKLSSCLTIERGVVSAENIDVSTWWRYQIEPFFRVTCLCEGNPPVTGGFPSHNQWRGALTFSLICAGTNGWANNRDAGDLRRHHVHYDVTIMNKRILKQNPISSYFILQWSQSNIIMTSSNGNIFRVTGLLCREFTGHQWIPCTKSSDAELWCFLWSAPE